MADARRLLVIVDDDAAVLGSLALALELEGFEVRAYRDAESLLAEDGAAGADCLIIDQKLPGHTGVQLLQRLRAQGVTAPALLITTPTPAAAALAAANDVELVGKPLQAAELVEIVRKRIAPDSSGRAPSAK